MGQKYTTQSTSGYNASPPPDDGTQVASNLVTWAGVKTKLADVLKTFGEAINTALVSALDLSARAISTPDTAVASDHWKTLQVTGNTTITLSSAASMGAGYEVGIFNAGTGVVTVTPGAAADTINGVSASVTVSIKGTKIFRTNQALTGYNVVGGSDPQTVTASTSVVTPLVQASAGLVVNANVGDINFQTAGTRRWNILNSTFALQPDQDNVWNFGAATARIASGFFGTSVVTPLVVGGTGVNLQFGGGAGDWVGDQSTKALRPLVANDNAIDFGDPTARVRKVFTPIIDTGTTGSGALKTNNGTTVLTWANTGAVGWGTGVANFGTITKRKTADESVTSSTALQDDDHLTFAIAANEEWVANYYLDAGPTISSSGIKVAVTVPSGATLNVAVTMMGTSLGHTASFHTTTSGSALDGTTGVFSTDASGIIQLNVWCLNGATPGNMTLQFAQSTSSGTAITVRKGSFMQATRVA